MRNLQEQVKIAFCYQKLFWPFSVWIICSSNLKKFANSWPSASSFKSFSQLLEHFFSHRITEQFRKQNTISFPLWHAFFAEFLAHSCSNVIKTFFLARRSRKSIIIGARCEPLIVSKVLRAAQCSEIENFIWKLYVLAWLLCSGGVLRTWINREYIFC